MSHKYKSIYEILSDAVEIDSPAERGEFLSRECEGDAEQRQELERLIRIHFAAGHLMERPAAEILVGQASEPQPLETHIPKAPLGGTLGDFQLVREIGRGGMGVVYEAHQISLNRQVALKVLPFAAVLDPRQLRRFETEAMAAAGLHHGNIVPVFHVGSDRAVHYYAMQYIEGRDVSDLIKQLRQVAQKDELDLPVTEDADFSLASDLITGRFEPADLTRPDIPLGVDADKSAAPDSKVIANTRTFAALSTKDATNKPEYFRTIAGLGIQGAEALEYAHQNGILHRDIKPSNLMLDGGGKLWITDFGLARIESEAGLTMTGDIMGTLRYMSPEQAIGQNDAVDRRCDIYSLGVTLYEMLSLSPVYPAKDRIELLQKQLREEPAALRQLNNAIPADLETIVHKAIAKQSDERYATAQEFADDLRRFLNGEPIHARSPSVATRISKWGQRNRTLAALLFTAAFIGGIVAAGIVVVIKGPGGGEIKKIKVPPDGTVHIEPSDPTPEQPHSGLPRVAVAEKQLAGLIPYPEKIDGIGRWQIITKQPCTFPTHFWSFEFSPNSRYVAFGEGDDVRVYSVPEFELVRLFSGHENSVIKVDWSPDGQRLASASADNTVRMWEFETGVPGPILVGHQDRVNAVAWHPDGQILASGCHDGEVRFWTIDGKPEAILRSHTSEVRAVSWNLDGSLLASTGKDGTIRLWDKNGQLKKVIDSRRKHIRSVAWSPDGQQLATTHHGDNTVRIWGVDGTPGPVLKGHKSIVTSASWTPDGKKLISGGWDETIREWNADGTAGLVRSYLNGSPYHVAWSPDGRWMMAALGGSIQFWKRDGSFGFRMNKNHSVRSVLWNSGGDNFAANVGQAGSFLVGIWNADASSSQLVGDVRKYTLTFDWSPNGDQLALGGPKPAIRLFDADGTAGHTIGPVASNNGTKLLAWSPKGDQIATKQGRSGIIQLRNVDGTAGIELSDSNDGGYGMAWNPQGDRLASVTSDGKLFLWKDDGQLEHTFNIGQMTVSVAWKPDGTQIATGSENGTIQLWTPDGHAVALLKGHENRVTCIAWSRDGQWIASGGRDSRIRLWTAAGGEVATLKGHRGSLSREISWHPHEFQFLSGGSDGTIRLWDAKTLQQLWILQVLRDGQSVKFAPDGRIKAGDPALIEREFRYILEKPTGAIEILKHSEFQQRTKRTLLPEVNN